MPAVARHKAGRSLILNAPHRVARAGRVGLAGKRPRKRRANEIASSNASDTVHSGFRQFPSARLKAKKREGKSTNFGKNKLRWSATYYSHYCIGSRILLYSSDCSPVGTEHHLTNMHKNISEREMDEVFIFRLRRT